MTISIKKLMISAINFETTKYKIYIPSYVKIYFELFTSQYTCDYF